MRLSEIAHPTFAVLCLSALATLGVSQTQDCSGCVASSTEPTVMALPPGVQVELPTEADAVSDKDGLCALNGENCGQRTPCSYVLSYTVSNTGGVTEEFVDKKEFQPGSTPGSSRRSNGLGQLETQSRCGRRYRHHAAVLRQR